jgi:hypothetical protein
MCSLCSTAPRTNTNKGDRSHAHVAGAIGSAAEAALPDGGMRGAEPGAPVSGCTAGAIPAAKAGDGPGAVGCTRNM